MSLTPTLDQLVKEWQDARREAVADRFASWDRLSNAEAALAAYRAPDACQHIWKVRGAICVNWVECEKCGARRYPRGDKTGLTRK